MSYRDYPRIGDSRDRSKKWDEARRRHPRDKHQARPCCVHGCEAPATHEVFVQVDWFRGNDEGPFKACRAHRGDPQALLGSREPA